jgi:hypothetical protein
MPYVRRNANGHIDSLHRDRSEEAAEFLDAAHPDVQAFVAGEPAEQAGDAQPPQSFSHLDAGFVRVIEDVIDTLIVKNVINITDLPADAQAKLFARKTFRERISKNSLRLFASTDFRDLV